MKPIRPSKTAASLVVLTLLAAGALVIQAVGNRANAQQQAPGAAKMEASKVLIDPADTVILLLDHQSGLFQTVKDISVAELRTNTVILAKVFGALYGEYAPNYKAVVESYQKAQDALKQEKK